MKWARTILRMIKLLALAYIGLLALVFLSQRRFIYHPGRGSRQVFDGIAKARGFSRAWENRSGQYNRMGNNFAAQNNRRAESC